jgi:hypothetical protein
LIRFVVPGVLTAVPAVITTRSPSSTMPLSRAASSERDHSSSTLAHSGTYTGHTPHSSASCETAVRLGVIAMIGWWGRSRATRDAVRPVDVGTTIARAPSVSARSQVAFDIACPTVGSIPRSGNWCR